MFWHFSCMSVLDLNKDIVLRCLLVPDFQDVAEKSSICMVEPWMKCSKTPDYTKSRYLVSGKNGTVGYGEGSVMPLPSQGRHKNQ